MMTSLRGASAVMATALVVTVVTACTPTTTDGEATPTPSSTRSSATPTRTATPVPTSTSTPNADSPTSDLPPASIIIGAEATDIVAADGSVLGSLRYATDGDAAVELATEILGEPTSSEWVDRMPHYAPADKITWGGFEIWINRYEPYNGEALEPPTGDALLYEPPFGVVAMSAEATPGVAIAAVDGTSVGDSYREVIAGKDPSLVYTDATFAYGSVALDQPESFPGMTDAGEGLPPMAHGVIGVASDGNGPITSIASPTDLYSLV
jgi:hypothetical protein